MKTNHIRAVAGWKTAALLALVAMVAAVAFGGVLSTANIAEAQYVKSEDTQTTPGGVYWVELGPGTTQGSVTLSGQPAAPAGNAVTYGNWTIWTIELRGKAKATFSHDGSVELLCRNARFSSPDVARAGICDGEGRPTTVGVQIKIGADTGAGVIVVRGRELASATTTGIVSIAEVKPSAAIASLAIKPAKTSIPASGTGNSTTIDVRGLTAAGAPTEGGVQHDMTVTTTMGLFTDGCTTNNSQVCQVDLPTAGFKNITLTAGGVPGVATLRATKPAGTLAVTATVTFHGPAANIAVAPDSGTLQVGGKTFVVVTVTDTGGNPVPGHKVTAANVTVAGPTTAAVKVTTKLNMPKEVGTPNGKVTAAGELPHCATGNIKYDTATKMHTATGAVATDIAGGTNAMGKCVIEVMAPKTPTMAARGNHMVTVKLSATKSATATIRVSGAPNAIKTNAPTSVDALSSTNIVVTVHDDADMPVGVVPIQIDQISGQGKVTTSPTMTANGTATFTYVAPLDGMAVFRIAAGTGAEQITEVVRLRIGEMADDADDDGDDMMGKTWNKTPTAAEPLLVWEGPNEADPATGAVEGVVAIWQRTGAGWLGYFPEAAEAGIPSTLTTLTNGEAYWVVVR